MLLLANDPGHDPHHAALGRLWAEQDLTLARIVDRRITAASDRLDISPAHDRRRTATGSAHTTGAPGACPLQPRPMSRTDPRIAG